MICLSYQIDKRKDCSIRVTSLLTDLFLDGLLVIPSECIKSMDRSMACYFGAFPETLWMVPIRNLRQIMSLQFMSSYSLLLKCAVISSYMSMIIWKCFHMTVRVSLCSIMCARWTVNDIFNLLQRTLRSIDILFMKKCFFFWRKSSYKHAYCI